MKMLFRLALILGIVGTAGVASTVPLCVEVVTTAASFEALGAGGCLFDDKIFSDFTYTYTVEDADGNLVTSNVPASAVDVVFSNPGGGSSEPVVSFLADWAVLNGEAGDIEITYTVTAPPADAMYFSSLTLAGSVSNVDPETQFVSYITGAESVCCPGPGSSVVPLGVQLDPPLTTSGLVYVTGTDQATYAPAIQIDISKDIYLSSGSDSGVPGGPPNGNEAELTQIDEGLKELTSIPEPLVCLLSGSGLLAIVLLSKKLKKFNNPRRTS